METPTLRFSPSVGASLADSSGKICVTGAGGWFGLATLEMLDHALGDDFDHRVVALASTARPCVLRSGRVVQIHALRALETLQAEDAPPLLAHYAFLTREKAKVVGADDYIRINRDMTRFVTGQCRRLGARGIFSTSSGAVYRGDGSLECDVRTNPYGFLKVEEEEAFGRISRELGVRVAICRVFNVAGPFLNKQYAIGSLIDDALFGDELCVMARHRVYRSFAHVADIVSVGFAVMLGAAEAPEGPFDTAGDEVVEVGELAERIRKRLGCPFKPIARDKLDPSLADDRYVGDLECFAALARGAGLVRASLDTQISDTAAYLRLRHGT